MPNQKENLILIGGGGHCQSVIDVIELENRYNIIGILDVNIPLGHSILGYKVIGEDKDISKFSRKENVYFLITVGQIKSNTTRILIHGILKDNNCKLATVISPRAYISPNSIIKSGTVIHHDVLINAGVEIGENCIINTKAIIEHGVKVGDFCHISTGAIVNGESKIADGCFLGSNSTISNSESVKSGSIINAGSLYLNSKSYLLNNLKIK